MNSAFKFANQEQRLEYMLDLSRKEIALYEKLQAANNTELANQAALIAAQKGLIELLKTEVAFYKSTPTPRFIMPPSWFLGRWF